MSSDLTFRKSTLKELMGDAIAEGDTQIGSDAVEEIDTFLADIVHDVTCHAEPHCRDDRNAKRIKAEDIVYAFDHYLFPADTKRLVTRMVKKWLQREGS